MTTAEPTRHHARADEEAELLHSIAAELARVMTDAGITKAQLARRLHIHGSGVSRLLGCKGHPLLATVARAFDALGYRLQVRAVPCTHEPDPAAPCRDPDARR